MIEVTNQEGLLRQILEEYTTGYSYVRSKRIQYRDRIVKYDMQRKDKNKINIHLIANTIDSLIGASWSGEGLTQKFESTDGFLGQDKTDKLNYVAKFDASQSHYQQLFYQNEQDRYFYGIGIMIKMHFDKSTMSPHFMSINPNTFIPDPWPTQSGLWDIQNYRYLGFMHQTSFFDMRNDPDMDKDALFNLGVKAGKLSQDSYLDRISEANRGNYIYLSVDSVKENFTTEIYHHFTVWKGKKYLCKTNVDQTILYSVTEIKPIFKSEKEDPTNIKWPVAITYYEPLRGDPFGKSICDRLEDKQDALSILFNLNIIKAKKEALGGDFLVNSRLIKNRQDLTKPNVDSKFIVADLPQGESLGNAIMEVPRSQVKPDSFNMIQALYEQASLDTGVDKLQQGIQGNQPITATQSQTLQANNNLKILLKNNIAAWGYKEFWYMWYREYVAKFTSVDKKFVVLNNDFESTVINLERTDFIGNSDPYIRVGTTSDIDAIDSQKLQMMQLERPQFMQGQSPQVSKDIFLRNYYRLMKWSENTINTYIPLSPSERKAKEYVALVNLGETPKSIFNIPGLDLFTCYLYIQQADNTEAKRKTLAILTNALIQQGLGQGNTQGGGQPGGMPQQGNAASNAASGMQMSQATQGLQPQSNSPQGALSRGTALTPNLSQGQTTA